MNLLRCLWFFVAFFDIHVSAELINSWGAADMLSRNNVTNFFLLESQVSRLPTPLPALLLNTHHHTQRARLGISQLQQSVQQYYTNGAARSTWNTYSAGQQRYLTFCADTQRQAVATSRSTLMLFVSHLAILGSHTLLSKSTFLLFVIYM